MAIVKEFKDGNTRIKIDDSNFIGMTDIEISQKWERVCKLAYEYQIQDQMKALNL